MIKMSTHAPQVLVKFIVWLGYGVVVFRSVPVIFQWKDIRRHVRIGLDVGNTGVLVIVQ